MLNSAHHESSIDELALDDRIRALAQELYEQRDHSSGSDLLDWLNAEDEVRAIEDYRNSWINDRSHNPGRIGR